MSLGVRPASRRIEKADAINARLSSDKQTNFEALALRFKDQKEAISNIERRCFDVESSVGSLKSEFSVKQTHILNYVTEMKGETATLIGEMAKANDQKLGAVSKEFGKLTSKLNSLQKRLAKFIGLTDKRFEMLERQTARNAQMFEAIEEAKAELA